MNLSAAFTANTNLERYNYRHACILPIPFFQSSIMDIIFICVECVCLLFSVSELAPPLKKTKIVTEVMIEEGTKVNIVTSLLMLCWRSSYLG